MAETLDSLGEKLDRHAAELRALRTDIERLSRTGSVDPASRILIEAIAEFVRVNENFFTAADLIEYGHEEAPGLLGAVIEAVGEVDGRRLGRKLAKLEGREVAGFRVERLKLVRDGMLWMLVPVRV